MKKIIIIGAHSHNIHDGITLGTVAEYWKQNGRQDLHDRLWKNLCEPASTAGEVYRFDMSEFPERGDALDALDENVEAVIALHLFGIDQRPDDTPRGPVAPVQDYSYYYCRENARLLPLCMELGIQLFCWGDQPWYGVQRRKKIDQNAMFVYETGPLTQEAHLNFTERYVDLP